MSRSTTLGSSWPPRGWERLGFIKELNAQAIVKDPMLATITGIFYKIEPVPIFQQDNAQSYTYRLTIGGWDYSIQNESREYNILSFCFQECLDEDYLEKYWILDIKTKSRPLILNRRSAIRSYRAAISLMKQIINGKVPDYERVLRLYKIHPTQRSLYEMDCNSEDCFYGLMPDHLDQHEDLKTNS